MLAPQDAEEILYEGTVAWMNINMNRFGQFSMSQYDFTIFAYCSTNKVVSIEKKDMLRVDEDNFMFWLDTSLTGCGKLNFAIKALIPDSNLHSLLRPEIKEVYSGYRIIESVASKK